MAVGGIGTSSSNSFKSSEATGPKHKSPADLLKEVDTDQSGSVSKDEFVAFGEQMKAIAPQPPKGASATNAPKMPSSEQLFAKVDTNSDNNLSVDELASMMAQAETQRQSSSSFGGNAKSSAVGGHSGHGGPPPAGGGKGGGGGMGVGGTKKDSSDSSQATKPADTNKDGTVSASEQLLYDLTHPSASASTSTTSETTTI